MRPRHGAGAQYLGIDRVFSGERIWLAGMWCYAAGILNPAIPAPASTPRPCPDATSGFRCTHWRT
jgi:hypothetical protein